MLGLYPSLGTESETRTYKYSGYVSLINHVERDHVRQIRTDLELPFSHTRNVQQVDVIGLFLQLLFLSSTAGIRVLSSFIERYLQKMTVYNAENVKK